MSQLASDRRAGPRRRADAERSIAAILDAAVELLSERPEASIEDIARGAGVARQTVYAHYASREALLDAVRDRALAEAVAAIDAAKPDEGPAAPALDRLARAAWQTLEHHARLLDSLQAPLGPEEMRALHQPILERLERLVRRGQRAGDFDRSLPPGWVIAAVLGLFHAAAGEVGAGRMSAEDAAEAMGLTVLRVCGVDG